MIFKNIFRSSLPKFYFSIGIIIFLFLLFFIYIAEDGLYDWRFYILFVLGINALLSGYYTFGISFDYNILLNYKKDAEYKQYLYQQLLILILSLLFNSVIIIGFLSLLGKDLFEMLLFVNLTSLSIIPIAVILSVFSFQKIDLFENQFVILNQNFMNYLSAIFCILFSLFFYFVLYDKNVIYSLFIIVFVYSVFFWKINDLVKILKKKVKNEYLRN